MNRSELAEFLRSRRARLRPEDVGLDAGARRRTPGLRREEVARLSGISVDYYMRIEQARSPVPSPEVLGALAGVLRLAHDERAYLYHLAGREPGPPQGPPREVPQSVLRLIGRLDDTPAYVMDAKYDILAWNDMAAKLIMDLPVVPERERNVIRWTCRQDLRGASQDLWDLIRERIADLRAASARYPGDLGIRELVAMVNAVPELAAVWAEHEVRIRRTAKKLIDHPVVGPLELHYDVLFVPDHDQRVVFYTAAYGTTSYDALRILKVVDLKALPFEREGRRLGVLSAQAV